MTRKQRLKLLPILVASALLAQVGVVFADSRPHFDSNDGTIFTGGWFNSASGCDTTAASYQAPNYGNLSGTRYQGAIMGFATVGGSRVGANSNLGAFSLGIMEGSSGSPSFYGFYTGLSGTNDLSFSNGSPQGQGSAYWGGIFDGSNTKRPHCIPDYWSKQTDAPAATNTSAINFNAATGKYRINPGGMLTTGGGTINSISASLGRDITYFVDGDVYITGNIVYGSNNANNTPKFALVAQGNIFIDESVTRLDGWYIAQPRAAGNEGVVWTCVDMNNADGRPPSPKDTWVRDNCGSTLTVNGALTAKQVNLLRLNGGLGSGSPSAAAEQINYTPQMVVGGSFFNEPPPQGGGLQSLISLPPVF